MNKKELLLLLKSVPPESDLFKIAKKMVDLFQDKSVEIHAAGKYNLDAQSYVLHSLEMREKAVAKHNVNAIGFDESISSIKQVVGNLKLVGMDCCPYYMTVWLTENNNVVAIVFIQKDGG